ncbi:MAG: DUF262 domain-containing HNH endonuclease family protein [Proteobacteria bacterium]|nr:DUF262 domain-containing HNH endonuclease family protein [Pseudomonadota bacterium]
MSNIIDIQQFLVGKTFHIPPYQRDYAWSTGQVDDFFCDVQEALETGSGHYLGTIVLAKNGGQSYELVDGQQRLTTLALVIQALLNQLDPTDSDFIANEAILLRNGSILKLDFGNNASFVEQLFGGNTPTPTSAGQRKLQSAYRFSQERAKALVDEGGIALVKKWLETIKSLEIIQFVATDTGRAIRMFQTVNDRGMPLTAMDKAKALLVYYSNRYLSGSLDGDINSSFGDCFAVFDSIREFVASPGYRIDNIARDTFTEDDLLRYHYLAYSHTLALNAADYNGTVRTVFDGFLKGSLKKLCQQPADLKAFISDYISDLRLFALSFRQLVSETATDERLYRLFVILGLAARLYPLTIRLHQRNLLRTQLPNTSIDLLHCLEVCDVRIYKTRGTDPAKDIGDLSHRSRTATVQEISDGLRSFVMWFMPDGTFQNSLSQDMYHNGALTLFLVRNEEDIFGAELDHSTMFKMVTDKITREHIIAQTPNWSITSQGFTDETDFNNHLHMFGNLTLLSRSDNSRCKNQPTHTKMTDPRLYARSSYIATRQLVHQYGPNAGMFTKTDVLKRTQALASVVMGKWAIW